MHSVILDVMPPLTFNEGPSCWYACDRPSLGNNLRPTRDAKPVARELYIGRGAKCGSTHNTILLYCSIQCRVAGGGRVATAHTLGPCTSGGGEGGGEGVAAPH